MLKVLNNFSFSSRFKKRSVGLDIRDSLITAVQLVRKKQTIYVASQSQLQLPAGIVVNGQVKDPEQLALAVKKALAQAIPAPINTSRVYFGLQEPLVYNLVKDLSPNQARQNQESLIEAQLTENIPLPADDRHFAQSLVMTGQAASSLRLVAASRSQTRAWQDVFKSLKLKLPYFDLITQSTYRALTQTTTAETVALVDMDISRVTIAVFHKNQLVHSFYTTLAGAAETNQTSSTAKAAMPKASRQRKAVSQAAVPDKESKLADKPQDIISQSLADAIAWCKKTRNLAVQSVVLAGDISRMPGLDKYLSDSLNLPVSIGEAKVAWLRQPNNPPAYLSAIGLALRPLVQDLQYRDIVLPLVADHKEAKQTGQQSKPSNQAPVKASRRSRLKPSVHVPAYLTRRQVKQVGLLLVLLLFGGSAVLMAFRFRAAQLVEHQAELEQLIVSTPGLEAGPSAEVLLTPEVVVIAAPVPENPAVAVIIDQTGVKAQEEESSSEKLVTISQTPTGWLNVRQGPGANTKVMTRVFPGESYPLLETREEWYNIKVNSLIKGWISNQYANIINN